MTYILVIWLSFDATPVIYDHRYSSREIAAFVEDRTRDHRATHKETRRDKV